MTVKKQKQNGVSLTFLLGILFELHVYSLHSAVCDKSSYSLSPSPSHTCFLSTLPRSAFQTKARGKIPAPKFRCCWLNKPSQWKSRQQPMRKQEGRWTQPYEMEKERAESSGEWCRREWGGALLPERDKAKTLTHAEANTNWETCIEPLYSHIAGNVRLPDAKSVLID